MSRAQRSHRPRWYHRVIRVVSTALLVIVVAVVVWHWPMGLGGSTQLVWVSGDSMEPTYQRRDLVVVRSGGGHQIGDVVLYPIPEGQAGEGILIIHRVVDTVERSDGTVVYITRGDNRISADPWEPSDDDIIGAIAYAVPFGPIPSRWVMIMLSPFVVAMLLGAVAAALSWSWLATPRPGRSSPAVSAADADAWPAPPPRCESSPRVCAGSPTHDSSPWTRPDGRDRRSHGW